MRRKKNIQEKKELKLKCLEIAMKAQNAMSTGVVKIADEIFQYIENDRLPADK